MTRLIGLDTETTDLDPLNGARIIEIAMLTYQDRKIVDRFVQRFDPECPINPKAQEVHGIAYSDLVGCPKWAEQAGEVQRRLAEADHLICHNLAFDAPFVAVELTNAGHSVPSIDGFCTMETGRWATADGKSPRLGELCFALGVPYDPAKAHDALYDVEVMMACFYKGYDRGFFKLPGVAL